MRTIALLDHPVSHTWSRSSTHTEHRARRRIRRSRQCAPNAAGEYLLDLAGDWIDDTERAVTLAGY